MKKPKIIELIEADKRYPKYADKYFEPLQGYKIVPQHIEKKLFEQGTIYDIAQYYFIYGADAVKVASNLKFLDRQNKIDFPIIEGIATYDYWIEYERQHFLEWAEYQKRI